MKTVLVTGKTKDDGTFVSKRLRRSDLNIEDGHWQVAIESVSLNFLSRLSLKKTINITTNIVQEREWLEFLDPKAQFEGPLEKVIWTPLKSFSLSEGEKTHYFPLVWYDVTNPDEFLKVAFLDAFQYEPFVEKNMLILMKFLFRKVEK